MGEIILGGRYIIESEIGTGGMAIVYKAMDKMLNRTVAVKVLRPEFKQDEEFIKRFDIEAKAAAGLSHPNIVGIYDVGIHEGLRYIVMEYVDGTTLKEYITKMGKVPWKNAFKFALQICAALGHAHERKVIHRDIKPHNIMVGSDGALKVMDFGIARATSASTTTLGSKVLGSAHYLSPEQARGGFTDERSDLYSLGVCLYEMVTGKVPFEADNTVAVAMQHLQKEPEKPSDFTEDLPAAAEYIILKAMRKEQSQRYLSASAMESDILRLMADPSVELSDNDNQGFYSTKQIDVEEIAEESRKVDETSSKKTESKNAKKIIGISVLCVAIVAVMALGAKMAFDWFYKGTDNIITPNLKGLTLSQAEEKVLELDEEIVVVVRKEEYSVQEEKDKIINQEPEEGKNIPGSKEIYVVVSLGAEMFKLDDFVGENSDYALEVVKELGLKGQIIVEENDDYNEKHDEGLVTRQEPAEGTMVRSGDVVILYESKGGEDIDPKIPDVTGMDINEAKTTLNNKGYYNINITEEVNKDVIEGTVLSQSPESPSRINVEDVIELVVSTTKEPENTEKEETSQKKATLTFTVPAGTAAVNVKVIRGDNGETVYKKTHNPLDTVSIEVKAGTSVAYEIYINDVFYEEKSVQG
ncbi:MAG: Stk1 family PASTA domain-containing Ser/Thr kinase [Clostridia bacterium]|nr:Stk1 family PASTA domain-containing Ser/Thr kinase [Clostridia bacterium]